MAGTPFRALRSRMRSDLRFSYVFRRRRADGEAEQVPTRSIRHRGSRSARWNGSPGPRWQCCRMRCRCPGLDQAEVRPAPAMEPAVLTSELPRQRTPHLGLDAPGRALRTTSALPLVIHLDGTPDHSAPSVRDALVHAGLIRPCVVVLVDHTRAAARPRSCSATGVLPDAGRRAAAVAPPPVSARRDPGDVALAGESFGGLCAMDRAASPDGVRQRHHPVPFVRLPP